MQKSNLQCPRLASRASSSISTHKSPLRHRCKSEALGSISGPAAQLATFRMELVPNLPPGVMQRFVDQAEYEGAPCISAQSQTTPMLVIETMQPKWVQPTADLLTHVFVEAQQFGTYRKLLKRRILFYLEEQSKLLPKTVLLTATLCLRPISRSTGAHIHQGSLEHNKQHLISRRSSMHTLQSTESLLGVGSATSACIQHQQHNNNQEFVPGRNSSSNNVMNSSDLGNTGGTGSRSPSSRDASSGHSESFVIKDSQGSLEVLVGTAEVSFDRITHGRHLILNPPKDCAYLCNMAVEPSARRLGIGRSLLEAVEQVARVGQESEVYLHMRVKDMPAAKLYSSAGYKEVGRDLYWLSKLLFQDQKMLLAKNLQ